MQDSSYSDDDVAGKGEVGTLDAVIEQLEEAQHLLAFLRRLAARGTLGHLSNPTG
jgi:hypothetical protein